MTSTQNKIRKYLKEVNYLLVLNNFKVEMEPGLDSEGNTTFTYSCEYKNRKSLGIIGLNNESNFYGLIADMAKFAYLEKEGFTDVSGATFDDQKLWRAANSPIAFVVSMAYPNHGELKFD
jgi:hypothetical protein